MDYRGNGFAGAQITAKEICEEMNIPSHLKEKHVRSTKTHFSCKAPEKPLEYALMRLEAEGFFNTVVDSAIKSAENRIQTINTVKDKFGILFD